MAIEKGKERCAPKSNPRNGNELKTGNKKAKRGHGIAKSFRILCLEGSVNILLFQNERGVMTSKQQERKH